MTLNEALEKIKTPVISDRIKKKVIEDFTSVIPKNQSVLLVLLYSSDSFLKLVNETLTDTEYGVRLVDILGRLPSESKSKDAGNYADNFLEVLVNHSQDEIIPKLLIDALNNKEDDSHKALDEKMRVISDCSKDMGKLTKNLGGFPDFLADILSYSLDKGATLFSAYLDDDFQQILHNYLKEGKVKIAKAMIDKIYDIWPDDIVKFIFESTHKTIRTFYPHIDDAELYKIINDEVSRDGIGTEKRISDLNKFSDGLEKESFETIDRIHKITEARATLKQKRDILQAELSKYDMFGALCTVRININHAYASYTSVNTSIKTILKIFSEIKPETEESEIISFINNGISGDDEKNNLRIMSILCADKYDNLDDVVECAKISALGKLSDYDIMKVLGKGGFYTVFLGYNRVEERMEAIRVLDIKELSLHILKNLDWTIEEYKKKEGLIAGRLKDVPNNYIASVYHTFQEGDKFVIIREYFDETLSDILGKGKGFSLEESLRIIEHTASAVNDAFKKKVPHGDLKPENIGYKDGEVRVIDFGLVNSISYNKKTGTINQGSTKTRAPELYLPVDKTIEERFTDKCPSFSLSVLLYQLVTGELPFLYKKVDSEGWDGYQQEVFQDIKKKLVDEKGRFLENINDKKLRKILRKGMAFDQKKRMGLEGFHDEIKKYRMKLFPEPDEKKKRLNRRIAYGALAAFSFLAVSAIGYLSVSMNNRDYMHKESQIADLLDKGKTSDVKSILNKRGIISGSFDNSRSRLEVLVRSYIDNSEYDSAIKLMDEGAGQIMEKFPDNKDEISLIRDKDVGQIKIYQRDYASAISLLEGVVKTCRKNQDTPGERIRLADAMMELGNAYREMGNYKQAALLLDESMGILERLKEGMSDEEKKAFFHSLVWIYQKAGYTSLLLNGCSSTRAVEYLNLADIDFVGSNVKIGQAWTEIFLGTAEFCFGRYSVAEADFSRSNRIFTNDIQGGSYEGITHSLMWEGKAIVMGKETSISKAIDKLSLSLRYEKMRGEGSRPSLEAMITINLGLAEFIHGYQKAGLKLIKDALDIVNNYDYTARKDYRNTFLAVYPACAAADFLAANPPERLSSLSAAPEDINEIVKLCRGPEGILTRLYGSSQAANDGVDFKILEKEALRTEIFLGKNVIFLIK